MKEIFVDHSFSKASQDKINIINMVLDEYRRQGFRLSLRQLYYQMVARDYIPNTMNSYKSLGGLVSTARQAGLIDWNMIEDRNRETSALSHWESPAEIVEQAARVFRIDKWADQDWHIEVMVEKDALSGVLQPVCQRLDIAITANKGYCSSSTMYEIGKRLEAYYEDGKDICVLYLGDHDPSGIDMTRDITERLALYSNVNEIEIIRLALNWDQIELWSPPENPAKETDSRFLAYMERYGNSSWELDAVEPVQLVSLIENVVLEKRNEYLWDEAVEREREMREQLQAFADSYGEQE